MNCLFNPIQIQIQQGQSKLCGVNRVLLTAAFAARLQVNISHEHRALLKKIIKRTEPKHTSPQSYALSVVNSSQTTSTVTVAIFFGLWLIFNACQLPIQVVGESLSEILPGLQHFQTRPWIPGKMGTFTFDVFPAPIYKQHSEQNQSNLFLCRITI